MMKMRRVPAILLVFLFSYSLIGPALWTDAQSNLPACCRRDGQHHCGMMNQETAAGSSSGLAMGARQVKCPCFPSGRALLPHCDTALSGGSGLAAAYTGLQILNPRPADAGYSLSFSSSHQKRGPPSFLS